VKRIGVRGRQIEDEYYRLHVERIEKTLAATPQLVNGSHADKQGRLWLAASAVSVKYGFTLRELDCWRQATCPWIGRHLGARKMIVREESSVTGLRELFLYAEGDLREIKAAIAAGRNTPADPWPSTEEAIAAGLTERALKAIRAANKSSTRPGVRVRADGLVTSVTEWSPVALEVARQKRTIPAGFVGEDEATKPPFGLTPRALHHWRNHCAWLGRAIDVVKAGGRCYYSRADLEQIAVKRAAGRGDSWIDPADRSVWITTTRLWLDFGIEEQIASYFQRREAQPPKPRRNGRGRVRSAPAIRGKVVMWPGKTGDQARVWSIDDALRYVAYRDRQFRTAKVAEAVFEDEDGGSPITVSAAARELKVYPNVVREWIAKGLLASVSRRHPHRRREVATVFAEDVRDLQAARLAASRIYAAEAATSHIETMRGASSQTPHGDEPRRSRASEAPSLNDPAVYSTRTVNGDELAEKYAGATRPDLDRIYQILVEIRNGHADLLVREGKGRARIAFDDNALTVTIDDKGPIHVENPRAYKLFRVIADASPDVINARDIQAKVSGTGGDKAIPRLRARLPRVLRDAVKSDTRGFWLQLPPLKKKSVVDR
jgi:hypothetical protein